MGKELITSKESLQLIQVEPIAYPIVQRFYKEARYTSKLGREDEVYALKDHHEVISAVRLTTLDGHLLLRSMVVKPDLRSQGIGHIFLEAVVKKLKGRACWCFPFMHLLTFYRRAGFELTDPSTQPPSIHSAYQRYVNQGRDIAVMKIY